MKSTCVSIKDAVVLSGLLYSGYDSKFANSNIHSKDGEKL